MSKIVFRKMGSCYGNCFTRTLLHSTLLGRFDFLLIHMSNIRLLHSTSLGRFDFLLIHMSSIRIFEVSHVCPACWPPCLAKTLTFGSTHKLFNLSFIPAMLICTIEFYHFKTSFSYLDPDWGSQCQHKAKVLFY